MCKDCNKSKCGCQSGAIPPHNHSFEEIHDAGQEVVNIIETYLDNNLEDKVKDHIEEHLDDKLDSRIDGRIKEYMDENLEDKVRDILNVDRIIDKGTLELLSATSARITGAKWVYKGIERTYTGTLSIPSKPSDPNQRIDIVSFAVSPVVKAGTASTDPVKPVPDEGHLEAHQIFRTHTGPDLVIGENSNPSTKIVTGQHLKYAPIWRQKLSANYYYNFIIGFVGWSSEYGPHGQFPLSGVIKVNFVTGELNTTIDPNRVFLQSEDMSSSNGGFVLVQTAPDEATLFARKDSYLGNMVFSYHEKTATVKDNSLIRDGNYGDLPAGTAYRSYNGRNHVHTSGQVRFDIFRCYGFGSSPVSGAVTFPADIADYNNPTRANTAIEPIMLHNAASFSINTPQGITLMKESGTYVPNVNNLIRFQCHKDESGAVKIISYKISQAT